MSNKKRYHNNKPECVRFTEKKQEGKEEEQRSKKKERKIYTVISRSYFLLQFLHIPLAVSIKIISSEQKRVSKEQSKAEHDITRKIYDWLII